MASLHLRISAHIVRNKVYPIEKDLILIGRDPGCDIVLPLPTVSRRHARVLRIDGFFYVEDAGSPCGTRVNQEQIPARVLLHDGDEIGFGNGIVLQFREETASPLLPDPS
jgi:pSer/pThr/pTyr-binding forkhead associated (FHA) protein